MHGATETPRGPAALASTRPHRRAHLAAVPLAACLAAALAACSATPATTDTGQRAPAGKVGDVLTVATYDIPQTLDPAKAMQNDSFFTELAYQPLIVRRSDGSLQPGLATSWAYDDATNTSLTLQLRDGVRFSDGAALSAQTVVDHFAYVQRSAGQLAPLFAGDTFTATGPLTVRITTPKPNPDLPTLLTQDDVVGGVISPDALKDPAKLGTQTFGAGPYQLDPAQTVTGDHYTYLPNPNYYDKASVHWKRVVIRVITNTQSILNALTTGQADMAVGDQTTLAAAQQAGLTVTMTPLLWVGVTLADRGGTKAPPLADVRVRQALNYATDRAAIASGIYPGNGKPTNQLTVPGGYGYDAALDSTYPYDVAKAKSLLAEAGYPNGFALDLVTGDILSTNLVAQALQQQWQQVGVALHVTDRANTNQYFSDAFSGAVPTFMTTFGQQPIWTEGPSLFLPSALFNPFHTTDPALQALYDRDAAATGAAKDDLDRQVEAYLVQQAWFVPVVTIGLPYYATSKITGTAVSPKAPLASLYEIQLAA